MDFFRISIKEVKNEPPSMYPDFTVGRSKDLMVKGGAFYAIWDEEAGLWSTDEYDVQRLVDAELRRYSEYLQDKTGEVYQVKYLVNFSNGMWAQFRKFVRHVSDNSHQLDQALTFADTEVKKTDYVARRLPYSLLAGDHSAWDELVGTLYSVEERAKIEWIIGCIVAGDSRKTDKFGVFYGPPGEGKGTILKIINEMFEGYTTTFNAKALGSSNDQFATEAFIHNTLLAIQFDGDLSRIEDNAMLNTIISHEPLRVNEKFKPSYNSVITTFPLMGTNKPVKITDAKSGIIRRLIDIHPTGITVLKKHYDVLMQRIKFEHGAIAQHCLEVYRKMGKNYYSSYRPTEMMSKTDVFFNFVEATYDVFFDQDSTTLAQAYGLYKQWCKDTTVEFVLPQYKFREELRNYFDVFRDRGEFQGRDARSVYTGFNANKYKTPVNNDTSFTLVMDESVSLLDDILADQPAQAWRLDEFGKEVPKHKWVNVTTTLKDLDTSELHFVKVPENHIVIDFDLKDEDGRKSLERNLEAASTWPATYGELSQGGGGVHLHYLYSDDVDQLSSMYSEGIEVKTLLGDASLRRRLSRCNNIPIAVLNRRLPLKEKKVLSASQMQSEKSLRDLIARNLRKEIHPGTKPSIDFIKKILDDAHEQGLSFDVTDMRGRIVSFANNSSNNAMYCLKVVQGMKFQGQETGKEPAKEEVKTDSPIAFFDVEVFPNLFVICWKFAGDTQIVKMINPSAAEVAELFKLKLVGFYNRRYDNHILWGAYLGMNNQQLFDLSQQIIVERDHKKMFGEAYGVSYADIWDFASIKQSLKLWEIDLRIPHKEINIPWDQPVPDELIEKVVDYCCNDLRATEAVFENRAQDFVARQILAELSGLSVNDTTQRHTARIIFGTDYNPQSEFVYTNLSKEFDGYTFEPTRKPQSLYRGEDPSEGGLVRSKPGVWENVAVYDVSSMHPTSIVQLNLFGPYTKNFKALLDARLAIKRGDYDEASKMLGGRLAQFLGDKADADALAYALKIVINIVYGLTSAKFDNPFRDLRNVDNIVAKRGALFMLDLKQACEEYGLEVVHIKTDSIKIPNATPEITDMIMNFGAKYGYAFELEAIYDKMALVNDAVYIARYLEPEKKRGQWEAVGAQFQHSYVYKSLFSKEEITFDDLCETRSVTKGAMYIDFEYDRPMATGYDGMAFIGRTGRFVPVKEGQGGGILYRVTDDKKYAVTGTKGYFWMEADMALALGDQIQIDVDYFEGLVFDAVKTIEKFGNFEEFVS